MKLKKLGWLSVAPGRIVWIGTNPAGWARTAAPATPPAQDKNTSVRPSGRMAPPYSSASG